MGKRLLVLVAHEDDETIGCGGLLALNSKQGGESFVYCASGGDGVRQREMERACDVLGATYIGALGAKDVLDIPAQRLLDVFRQLIVKHAPEVLVTHDVSFDYNLEHRRVGELALAAAQRASHGKRVGSSHRVEEILLAETSNLFPSPERIYDISDVFSCKQDAMACHESQLYKGTLPHGYYALLNDRKASLRGLQAGVLYGEAFLVRSLPVFADVYSSPLATRDV